MTSPRSSIDLNADLGEGCPWDEALLDRVSSASISCGAHAGDDDSIRHALLAARERGVVVGAHPGYADREHFGRRNLDLSTPELASLIRDQVASLAATAGSLGISLRFVKPHGALYNQAQADPGIAAIVVESLLPTALPVVGQPGSCVEEAANRAGLRFIGEGFADRRYRPDGRLVPRSDPGAVLHDREEIGAQVAFLVSNPGIHTICLHGDNPEALVLADLVLGTLRRAGVAVGGFA